MRTGDLRNRIVFEQRSSTVDAANEPIDTWTPFWTCYAAFITPRRPSEEQLQSGSFRSIVKHQIRVRYHAGLTADMRINFGGRLMNITGIKNEEELNITLLIDAIEGQVPDGH